MDLYVLVVTCVVNILLGAFVLLRNTHKRYAQLFMLMSILISVWIVSNYMTNHLYEHTTLANATNKLAYFTGYASVASGLLFSYFFPVIRKVRLRETALVSSLVILPLALSFTNAVVGEVTVSQDNTGLYSVGPLINIYIIFFLGLLVLLSRNLLSVTVKHGRAKKRQARFILLAFVTSALLGLALNIIIPILLGSEWHTTRAGPLVTIILVSTIAYTIVRHGLFDMRLAVVRTFAYTMSLFTLASLYYAGAFALSATLLDGGRAVSGQNYIGILLVFVVALLFQPVKHFFDHLADRIFYRSNYSIDDFLLQLSRKLTQTTELRGLLQRAANEIVSTLKVEQGFFFVHRNDSQFMSAGTTGHVHVPVSDIEQLETHFYDSGSSILLASELAESADLHKVLSRHNIAVVMPMWQGSSLLGCLFLGEKRIGSFAHRDIRALETVRDALVIAIHNAMSVHEVKELNATLQQRIDEATKELRASNAQLQRLDEAKDEFVSMASHQLRTPLTSVKGYISMVLEGDVGEVSETQRKMLGEAFTSSERMVHLINDFLNVSRLQTGKFIIDRRSVDLVRIVGQEIDSLKTTAEAHSLKLHYKKSKHALMLHLDEGKIRQVVMNFIDNAIFYSREHSIIEIDLSIEDGDAVLQVRDNGIGVPKAEQAKLFSKFFRARNARKQRPDGTGVGLFLAKKVIDAHGGRIIFESVEGEGSMFGFRLPMGTLTTNDKTDKLN